jgi:protein-tyrosine-phosphatase
MRPSVLFVCLGNICRSPLAEAAMKAEAARLGLDWEIESAGTGGWHVGDPPDRRAQATALRHGVDISGYRGRQVKAADFRHFSHVVALDADNLANLKRLQPKDGTARAEPAAGPRRAAGAVGGRSLLWRGRGLRGHLARGQRGRGGAGERPRRLAPSGP